MAEVVELRADGVAARVSPSAGGRLASLQVDGLELLVTGAPSPLDWGCYPMVPWAGRLGYGHLRVGPGELTLPATLGPHAIHGTTWSSGWDVVDATEAACHLSVDLAPAWPWPGRAASVLSLRPDGLTWHLTVHADEHPFPAVVGWHPWFRRQLARGAPAALRPGFGAATRRYERAEDMLPTGRLVDPGPGPWDDCFCALAASPVLRWPGAMDLRIGADGASHLVIYDQQAHAVCVEPQTGPPDAARLGEAARAYPGRPVAARLDLHWRRW